MKITTPKFVLKDLEMNGTLEKSLRSWRKEGLAYRVIAAKLSESGMLVHRATVDNWCKQLGIK